VLCANSIAKTPKGLGAAGADAGLPTKTREGKERVDDSQVAPVNPRVKRQDRSRWDQGTKSEGWGFWVWWKARRLRGEGAGSETIPSEGGDCRQIATPKPVRARFDYRLWRQIRRALRRTGRAFHRDRVVRVWNWRAVVPVGMSEGRGRWGGLAAYR